jgi:hypothetical protein
MPLVGPTPLFHAIAVIVIFDPAIPLDDARRAHGAVTGLVRRLADEGASPDDLAAAIPPLIAEYGFAARQIGRAREAMEFSVDWAAATSGRSSDARRSTMTTQRWVDAWIAPGAAAPDYVPRSESFEVDERNQGCIICGLIPTTVRVFDLTTGDGARTMELTVLVCRQSHDNEATWSRADWLIALTRGDRLPAG